MTYKSQLLGRSALGAGAVSIALSFAVAAAPASAQDTPSTTQPPVSTQPTGPASSEAKPTDQGEIVVTGSRIPRADLSTPAPLAVVTGAEFKQSGAVNVESVINRLPQVVPGATAFSNNPGGGVATLNLRNLGSTRTLVLVNGRRYMFYDVSQRVDLNTIPQFLLAGVDVVTGGASAVYGSDAISGVVNFRLRTDLQGIEMGTQYSITGHGDGPRWDAHVALGGAFADNRGHVTVYGEYYNRGSIFQNQRNFSTFVLGDDGNGGFVPGGSATTNVGRFSTSAALGAGTNFGTSLGATFSAPGAPSRPFTAADLFNFAPANYLMVPQERWLLGGYGDYEVSDHITAYTEVGFVNNRVQASLAPTPVTGTFLFNIAAACTHLAAVDCAALQTISGRQIAAGTAGVTPGLVSLSIGRRTNEVGNRVNFDDRNGFRLLGGLRGDIVSGWTYDAYYSYARTRNAQVQAGNVSRSGLQASLLDGTCNIFGAGTMDAACVSSVSILAQNQDISVLQVASGSVTGRLFNTGWARDDVSVAFGGEWRSMHSRFIPDTALSSGDVIGFNAGQATGGRYSVKEVFGELRIPIASGRPFFDTLELDAAGRHSKYSLANVGGVNTYALSAKWAPVRDIMFRGQYSRAVRAPNVGELFGGLSQGFPAATDPCSLPSALTNPGIKATCIATGVPAAALGTGKGLQPNTQIEGEFGGNPNLQEERSTSYTFGVVLRPRFVPRFNVTLDYFNIKVRNVVGAGGGGVPNILNLCYNVIQNANDPICRLIHRDPANGQIDGGVGANGQHFVVSANNANLGFLYTDGVDLQADYSLPLSFGLLSNRSRLNFFFLGTYTRHDDTQVIAGQSTIRCAGFFGLNCGNPHPKYKWDTRLTWADGPVTVSGNWTHLSSVNDDDPTSTFTVEHIKSYDMFGLSTSFDIGDHYSLTMGVNNLFNRKPPLVGDNQQQANTFPSVYDVLGRDFFVSVGLRF